MTSARAAVLRNRDEPYDLETIKLPDPGPGEVLVRIVAAGHCHTDLLLRSHAFGLPLPTVPGHEGAGVVEAIGTGVSSVAVGNHVICSYAWCGTCRPCRRGQPYACEQFALLNLVGHDLTGRIVGADAAGGAVGVRWFGQSSFATHSLVNERTLVRVDDDVPLHLVAPLGCGIQTGAGSMLNVLRPAAGDHVAVWGTGAVGLAAIMAAAAVGCAAIVAVDLNAKRRELALELGATAAVDGAAPDAAEQVIAATGGGADGALDTTGLPSVIAAAVSALRVPGTLGLIGVAQGDIVLPGSALSLGKTIVGIIEGSAQPQEFLPRLIALWRAGRFPLERLVVTYPLDAIDRAEADALAGLVIKPVLLPG